GELQAGEQAVHGKVVADPAERHVVGQQHHAELSEQEQHGWPGPGLLTQYLRVPLVTMARRVHRLLVERRGDHRLRFAGECKPSSLLRVVYGRRAVGRSHLAPTMCGLVSASVADGLESSWPSLRSRGTSTP